MIHTHLTFSVRCDARHKEVASNIDSAGEAMDVAMEHGRYDFHFGHGQRMYMCFSCCGKNEEQKKYQRVFNGPDCEHGVADGDWCEPCAKEYKRAAREAGLE